MIEADLIIGLVFGLLIIGSYCLYLLGEIVRLKRDARLDELSSDRRERILMADNKMLREQLASILDRNSDLNELVDEFKERHIDHQYYIDELDRSGR